MKKVIAIFAIATTLVACGGKGTNEATTDSTAVAVDSAVVSTATAVESVVASVEALPPQATNVVAIAKIAITFFIFVFV